MQIKTYELGQIGTNSYLLYPDNTDEAVLVDAPLEASMEIPAALKRDGKKLAAILLTHGHWDHAWDAGKLQRLTGAKVFAGENGRQLIETPEFQKKHLFSGTSFDSAKIDVLPKDGETIDVAGIKFKCLSAEGHCPGSLVYYAEDGARKIAFVGDVIFSGSVGRADLWGGDFSVLEKAIREKIYTLPKETMLFPGHGDPTTVEIECGSNPFVRE